MHRLVEQHPAVVELDELQAKAKADAEKAKAELAKQWEDYRAASAHAARSGSPMPPAPDRNVASVTQELRARETTLSRLRDEVLVEHASEMRELLLGREQELLDEAAPLAKRLNEIADELSEMVGTARYVARQNPASYGPVEGIYSRNRVDIGVLIVATEHGWRFLAEPLAPAPSNRPAGTYNTHDSLVVHGGSM